MTRTKVIRYPLSDPNGTELQKSLDVILKFPNEVQGLLIHELGPIFAKGLKETLRKDRISAILAAISGMEGGPDLDVGDAMAKTVTVHATGMKSSGEKAAQRIELRTSSIAVARVWRRMHNGYSVVLGPELREQLLKRGFTLAKTTRILSYKPRNMFNRTIIREGKNIKRAIGEKALSAANLLISEA